MSAIPLERVDLTKDGSSGTRGEVSAGHSSPLGATVLPDRVNFSIYSRSAARVELLFFDRADNGTPQRVIPLEADTNRTDNYWHVCVHNVKPGQLYAYRVYGPFDPSRGMRFDPGKVLLDPYGCGVAVPTNYNRDTARQMGDNAATAMKSVVLDPSDYNWEGDLPLNRPASQTIIYEMHVRGFTRHPSSGISEAKRGTYAGLIEKIPYLQELGITAVELLPVFQFDAQDAPQGLVNYWGYAPVSFFAPHAAYSSRRDPLGPIDEFRDMVKALHRAGIEVILDVVFNHTGEGNQNGPTLSFRGLENSVYYILGRDPSGYANYSGTGNTLNGNHPIVRRMILDSLHYWVEQMHVDGFRFDLASILERDESGTLLPNPPVVWDIDTDPVVAGAKLIAEAWDAAGLYQVGNFAGDKWREWNGRFRDDVRSFFRGDGGSVGALADRLVGSPQIYAHKGREAEASVNFVTCHDGLTLNDLVSYNQKHNEANGENNRDGTDDNRSRNWGVEGPTDDPAVEKLRNRLVKNFLMLTVASLGLPMILMGDEVRRTQNGNNNAYCQDNEMSWFDWTRVAKHAEVLRFARLLCSYRLVRDFDPGMQRLSLNQLLQRGKRSWHGVKLGKPDWSFDSHSLATSIEGLNGGALYLILNGYWESLEFELPPVGGDQEPWRRTIDTSLDSPDDIVELRFAPAVVRGSYLVAPHSVVVLFSRATGTASTKASTELRKLNPTS